MPQSGRRIRPQLPGGRWLRIGPDSWHRDQDRSKSEVVKQPLYLAGEPGALGLQVLDGVRDTRDDHLDGPSTGHRDALLVKSGEHLLDELLDATVLAPPGPCMDSGSACPAQPGGAAIVSEQVQGELVGQPRAGKDALEG